MSSLVQNMVMQFLKWRYNFMKGLSENENDIVHMFGKFTLIKELVISFI